jgi:hypothetical protein
MRSWRRCGPSMRLGKLVPVDARIALRAFAFRRSRMFDPKQPSAPPLGQPQAGLFRAELRPRMVWHRLRDRRRRRAAELDGAAEPDGDAVAAGKQSLMAPYWLHAVSPRPPAARCRASDNRLRGFHIGRAVCQVSVGCSEAARRAAVASRNQA